MASVNKVILIGNCGRDPEVRYMPNGKAACNISIATSSKRKDRDTGETIEDTQWHRVQFFDKLAEIVGEYVKKGSSIYVEGRLRYGKYTDKDGVEHNTTDIIADQMQMLGGREGGGQRQDAPRQQRPAQEPSAAQSKAPSNAGSGFDDMDDDIPF